MLLQAKRSYYIGYGKRHVFLQTLLLKIYRRILFIFYHISGCVMNFKSLFIPLPLPDVCYLLPEQYRKGVLHLILHWLHCSHGYPISRIAVHTLVPSISGCKGDKSSLKFDIAQMSYKTISDSMCFFWYSLSSRIVFLNLSSKACISLHVSWEYGERKWFSVLYSSSVFFVILG